MSDSIDWNLIFTLWIGVGIPMLGWIYVSYKQRKLAIAQWKYNMKAKHYGFLSESLKRIINSQNIKKQIYLIDIENEDDLKANSLKLGVLAGLTLSEIIMSDVHEITQEIDTSEDLTVERLGEISGIIVDGCNNIFYTSVIDMNSQREWIELYEPDNVVIDELIEDWDKLLGEESLRMINTVVFTMAEMEGFIPPDDPEWVNKMDLEYKKIRDLMKQDLKETL